MKILLITLLIFLTSCASYDRNQREVLWQRTFKYDNPTSYTNDNLHKDVKSIEIFVPSDYCRLEYEIQRIIYIYVGTCKDIDSKNLDIPKKAYIIY